MTDLPNKTTQVINDVSNEHLKLQWWVCETEMTMNLVKCELYEWKQMATSLSLSFYCSYQISCFFMFILYKL